VVASKPPFTDTIKSQHRPFGGSTMSKPSRRRRFGSPVRVNQLAFVTSSILGASAAGAADPAAPGPGPAGALEDVVVTAQKRSENLQNVPVSVQALDSKKLEELQVSKFDDYAKYLPSLSFQSYGPGQAQLYVRGVTNGNDGLHVGSQPLVGVYLDEQPVTTIANNLDVHIYDIARVEALSGPQGTLFGSSSMAGTLRIITNKPSTTGFEAGYDLGGTTMTTGGPGGKAEGFVNVPLSDHAAIRLVGFAEHDGGYINNVLGPPEAYPTSGVVRSNAGLTKKHYNEVNTSGGRAALKVDLENSWSVTPMVMAQNQTSPGQFAYTPELGNLNIARYYPERNDDRWYQASLTVEGKISDFDFVYAGGYIHRQIDNVTDYTDYSYFYDVYYTNHSATPTFFGDNFRNNNGDLISPAQLTVSGDTLAKISHEMRIASPSDWRTRVVAGAFFQHQGNNTRNEYRVENLATAYSITGLPGVLYLNAMWRVDRDKAVFGEVAHDITDKLTVTGGLREFGFDNTVYGFFGYNGQPTFDGYTHKSGAQNCEPGSAAIAGPGRPCINVDSRATKTGSTYKLNFTYKIDPDRMLYMTWSTGFRPGGVNRVQTRPPYTPDYLTNYEAGWKTTWFDHRLRINGAVFFERWKDAQYGITGLNGITEIINAGAAQIRGIEGDVHLAATDALTLSGSVTFLDSKLVDNACKYASPSHSCLEPQVDATGTFLNANQVLAPAGTRLPVSPRLKGNLIARYAFKIGDVAAHVQAAGIAQSFVVPALTVADAQIYGNQPGYASFDFAAGFAKGSWSAELYLENAFDNRGQSFRYTSCSPATCTLVNVIPIRPRMVGVTFGQKF
jgi:iron complex outermembrane receptor protein